MTMTLPEQGRLQKTLDYLREELCVASGLREHVFFGSTSLIIRGILDREPGDIDMFVTKRLWGQLLAREGWHVETPKAGDPPILVNDTQPIIIHAFFAWSDEYVKMPVEEYLYDPEMVPYDEWAYPCVPIEEALRHKTEAIAHGARAEKHLPDIDIINNWLDNRP